MSRTGVLYLTSPSDFSIRKLAGMGTKPVLTDKRLRWPDTFSEGPDGTMYVTASHIQDTQWFTPGAPPSITTQLFCFPPTAWRRDFSQLPLRRPVRDHFQQRKINMADDKTKRAPQDSSRVNIHEDYEVKYWTSKWGVTRAQLESSVKKVGVSAAAVAKELGK